MLLLDSQNSTGRKKASKITQHQTCATVLEKGRMIQKAKSSLRWQSREP